MLIIHVLKLKVMSNTTPRDNRNENRLTGWNCQEQNGELLSRLVWRGHMGEKTRGGEVRQTTSGSGILDRYTTLFIDDLPIGIQKISIYNIIDRSERLEIRSFLTKQARYL